jgi:DNA-binding NarL/FixJ family response regulator
MNKIKVLLADDHAILRDGISALLSLQNDIEIIGQASNGQEAVALAKKLNPDVVLIDVSMPQMDGLEATRRIKKDNPRIKVLVLTQHDNDEYILATVKSGSDGYLPKRALGQELLAAIHAVYQGNTFLYPTAAAALFDDYRQHVEKEPYDSLTDREKEVFRLIAEGHTSRVIADRLFISLKTVLNHREKIMEKLNIHHSNELIKLAIRKGLINS